MYSVRCLLWIDTNTFVSGEALYYAALENSFSSPSPALLNMVTLYYLCYCLLPEIHQCTERHSTQNASSLFPPSPCKWSQSDLRDEYPEKKDFRQVNLKKISYTSLGRETWERTSYLWAERDFSETLLYGNFLCIWTDQEDLRPANLKQTRKKKTATITVFTNISKLSDGAAFLKLFN